MEHTYKLAFHSGKSGFEVESTDLEWLEKKEKEYLEKMFVNPTSESTPSAESSLMVPQNLTINEFFKKYIKSKQHHFSS